MRKREKDAVWREGREGEGGKKKQEKVVESGQSICIRERTDIVFQIGIRGIGLLGSK